MYYITLTHQFQLSAERTKWIFTNKMFAGEITLEEYTEIHKKLIERFDPPMNSVETPGFYVQEAFDNE